MTASQVLQEYISLFEHLSTELSAKKLASLTTDNVRFSDPFHDITGRDKMLKVLEKTLSDVKNPAFSVSHAAWDQGVCFLRWTFSGQVRGLGDWTVVGMSEIHFAEDGRISQHIDHWDAANQCLVKLPILGSIIRAVLRRFQAT